MGVSTDGLCVNCNSHQETRNHLFSNCSMAARLWNSILNLNGMNQNFSTWEGMVSRACLTWKGKSLLTTILKISWNAFIYYLWQERNQRIFQARFRDVVVILKDIIDTVGIRLRDKVINRLEYQL
ncbi:uncharacterized protein LOC120115199 [Hibiscus syriacus]|uniref:uncharacterized protein LOC120115199 n=1 Tax=Hibiscus syriacus TaxID=106335 RepID=UPI001921584F|nr:uncharacterized protein LOC120115199 [Hibiscus syriacus]